MDNIFLFIVGIFIIVFYANRGGDRETVEGFNDTISKMSITDLQNLIYSTYKADVQAIKNLADTAAKLQAGGLTVPGNLNVSGNISGPTVNDLNTKITNAINSLTSTINTNINNTKNDLQAKIDTLNNRIKALEGKTQNINATGNSASFDSITVPTINATTMNFPGGMWMTGDPGNKRIGFFVNWARNIMWLNAACDWQKM